MIELLELSYLNDGVMQGMQEHMIGRTVLALVTPWSISNLVNTKPVPSRTRWLPQALYK